MGSLGRVGRFYDGTAFGAGHPPLWVVGLCTFLVLAVAVAAWFSRCIQCANELARMLCPPPVLEVRIRTRMTATQRDEEALT